MFPNNLCGNLMSFIRIYQLSFSENVQVIHAAIPNVIQRAGEICSRLQKPLHKPVIKKLLRGGKAWKDIPQRKCSVSIICRVR